MKKYYSKKLKVNSVNSKNIKEIFLLNREKKGENVALFFPNNYYIGSTNLGFQKVYEKLNQWNFTVSRFFFDNDKIFSPDTDKSLKDFKIIFISISYEYDLINILFAFYLEKITILNELRNNEKDNKLEIFIGGASVLLNPFIFGLIADFVFIGEIDEIKDLIELRNRCLKPNELIIEPLYKKFFCYYSYIFNRRIISKDFFNPSYTYYLDLNNKNFYFFIEYSRGCKFKCRFCNYWLSSKNHRIFNEQVLFNLISKACKYKNDIGILSAYPIEIDFLKKLRIKFPNVNFHFSSLRLEEENQNLEILMYYKDFKINTITLAPETPFEEDRFILGKKITDNFIFEILSFAKKFGFNRFKFYFIIGIFEDEIKKFEQFIFQIKKILKGSFIKFSINPYIMKTFNLLKRDLILKKDYQILVDGLKAIFIKNGITYDFLDYDEAFLQYNVSNVKKFYSISNIIKEKMFFVCEKIKNNENLSKKNIKDILLFNP